MEQKIIRGFLIILILLGLWLRLSGTINGFFAFNFDQGKDFIALYDLVYRHNLTLIGPSTGIDGVFHGVWWYYLLAPLFWIFSGNPQLTLVSFSVFCSLSILLAFWLGKKILNEKLGFILAGLVSVSIFFIRASVQLWHPFVVPVLLLIFLLFLWKYLTQGMSFFWIGFLLGLIFEFEFATGGMFLLSFLLALILVKRPIFKQWFLGIFGFIIWLLPRIIFDVRHGFIQLKSFLNYFFNFSAKTGQLPFLERLGNRAKSFFNIFSEAFGGDNQLISILLLIFLGIIYISFIKNTKNNHLKKFFRIIVLLLTILFFITSLYPDTLWNYYLISLPVLFLPFVGISLYFVSKKLPVWGWLFYAGLIILNFAPWNLPRSFSWQGDASTFKNEIAVIDAIYRQAEGKEFNLQVYSPAVIYYNYQYLFLWYGKNKYGYLPEKDKIAKTAFFIIEPNPNHPTLPNRWLRERDGDGKIYWQEVFTGDIKVEERIR